MGNTAGSGAYWIASEGTTLLAEPATLTGSIGVVAAKPVLDRLWQRLGVTWAEIPQGENASIWSLNGPYSPAAKARVESLIDTVYAQFKDTVGRNRHMGPARVEELAKGRVWTGSQAAQNGLVDKIGGLHEALAELRTRLNLAADAPLALEPYPKPASPLKRVEKLFGESVGTVDTLVRVGTVLLPAGMLAAPAILVR
jgi:protease-4